MLDLYHYSMIISKSEKALGFEMKQLNALLGLNVQVHEVCCEDLDHYFGRILNISSENIEGTGKQMP